MPKTESTQITLLKNEIEVLKGELELARDMLKFEKVCCKIDRKLDKEKYQKMFRVACEISKEYLDFLQTHHSEIEQPSDFLERWENLDDPDIEDLIEEICG